MTHEHKAPTSTAARLHLLFELGVLMALAAFSLYHLQLPLLLSDTTTVGGDTPAHNYIASQLTRQLLTHGRIVGWAPGWWAGFPLFQYYFPLPYLIMAALSALMPFNIAFKLVSVLGILALPATTFAALRMLRFPRPTPILGALAAQAFLFSQIHVMWGANVLSTLAGMIANSISFALLPIVIALWYRDALAGHARLRSSLLALLLVSSHFFTSLVAALTIATIPFLLPAGRRRGALRTVLANGVLTATLTAWWVLPLLAKGGYSVDFGGNWETSLRTTLEGPSLWLAPLILVAAFRGLMTRSPAILIFFVMLVTSGLLFTFGYEHLSPVFVNVRMWPFMHYAWLMLIAIGAGAVVAHRRASPLFVTAVLLLALLHLQQAQQNAKPGMGPIRSWAKFNFEGLEAKPGYTVVQDLLQPLRGTPGRLAHDLSEEANVMGSSRIFELSPHLIGKPIIEGGLVSSGISSYFTYYIQCELSRSCAGSPSLMVPTTYDVATATRHLELFNVKHLIARSPQLRADLHASSHWRPLKQSGAWESFELMTHPGRYVTVPSYQPRVVSTEHWETYALEWFYRPQLLDQPFIFQSKSRPTAPRMAGPTLTEAEFRQILVQSDAPSGDIVEWLHAGPLPIPSAVQSNLLDYTTLIDERTVDPLEGGRIGGTEWQLLQSQAPQVPGRLYRSFPDTSLAYSFVNVFVPTTREALLHYGNDGEARIVLNGETIVTTGGTAADAPPSQPIRLKAGRNRLLHKLEQRRGQGYFYVRLTDTEGMPFHDLIVSTERQPPLPLLESPEPVDTPEDPIIAESVEDHRIRFITRAIGQPHIIACSYFPNWKVRGATAIHLVSPSFMLVYPTQSDVEIVFGRTRIDWIGMAITAAGWLFVASTILIRQGYRYRAGRRRPASPRSVAS